MTLPKPSAAPLPRGKGLRSGLLCWRSRKASLYAKLRCAPDRDYASATRHDDEHTGQRPDRIRLPRRLRMSDGYVDRDRWSYCLGFGNFHSDVATARRL